jgi:hypothetical protein
VGKANLTITIKNGDPAGGNRWTLTCEPGGGNHPDPAAACQVLAAHGEASLKSVPATVECTQIYGGAQTATIAGTWRGQPVQATLNRTNGCEIARWTVLTGLLPPASLPAGGLTTGGLTTGRLTTGGLTTGSLTTGS